MRRFSLARVVVVGLLAGAFFQIAGRGRADIDAKMHDALSEVAKALARGDKAGAAKGAKDLAKRIEDLDDLMHAFKPRSKGGLGVGSKPGVVVPDGIEQRLNAIARGGITPLQLAKEGDALTEAAWMTAAIAEVAKHLWRYKDKGGRTQAKWLKFAAGVGDGARDLAAGAKKRDLKAVNKAATKITNNCNNCHAMF